jgi:hypothetical protein
MARVFRDAGVAAVAIQDPVEAVKELRRAVEELKFVAESASKTCSARRRQRKISSTGMP